MNDEWRREKGIDGAKRELVLDLLGGFSLIQGLEEDEGETGEL